MKNNYENKYNELIDNGWTLSHNALYNGYHYSGTVTPMKNRQGKEYCRLHIGKCKNVKTYANGFINLYSYQITYVFYRPIEKGVEK